MIADRGPRPVPPAHGDAEAALLWGVHARSAARRAERMVDGVDDVRGHCSAAIEALTELVGPARAGTLTTATANPLSAGVPTG